MFLGKSKVHEITYRDTVGILLSDTLSFRLALLEGVFVLKLAIQSRRISLLHS